MVKPTFYTLYIDETGNRYPDHIQQERQDDMDWFCWGGVLVKKDEEEQIITQYKELCATWEISYPLHSTKIRGRRKNFSWLQDQEKWDQFIPQLSRFLNTIPVLGFGVVISRPGYNKRYKEKYGNGRWELCKTTHPILIERTVRYLQKIDPNARLKIVFEGASSVENKLVMEYTRNMIDNESVFNRDNSDKYSPLAPKEYQKVLTGKPNPGTKANIFLQIADLYIYPIAKGKYNPKYPPWKQLLKNKKVVDALLRTEDLPQQGIKYYCFDT